jgi:hypothetical protein
MDLRLQDVHLSSQRDNIYEMQNPSNTCVWGIFIVPKPYKNG